VSWERTFKFQRILFVKRVYYMKQNEDKIMTYMALCGKKNTVCAACLKNAVSILVV